ncbi:hypothetical protein ACWIWA_09070 [Ursidibacter arcticus]
MGKIWFSLFRVIITAFASSCIVYISLYIRGGVKESFLSFLSYAFTWFIFVIYMSIFAARLAKKYEKNKKQE